MNCIKKMMNTIVGVEYWGQIVMMSDTSTDRGSGAEGGS